MASLSLGVKEVGRVSTVYTPGQLVWLQTHAGASMPTTIPTSYSYRVCEYVHVRTVTLNYYNELALLNRWLLGLALASDLMQNYSKILTSRGLGAQCSKHASVLLILYSISLNLIAGSIHELCMLKGSLSP